MERDEAWIRKMYATYERLVRKHQKLEPIPFDELFPTTRAVFKGVVRAARRKQ